MEEDDSSVGVEGAGGPSVVRVLKSTTTVAPALAEERG
jgi:hypothetical protein